MEPIVVTDLRVRRGGRVVVEDVSFTAAAGQVLALLGPNGAGKTTTLETLEGYLRPDFGTVRVLGLDPTADRIRLSSQVGVLLQEGGLYPPMSPNRALRLFASYYRQPTDPDELLGLLGLTKVSATPAKRLSGGERRRLALGLALVGRPEVLFLDEPTAGVDPEGRLAVRAVIDDQRRRGCCVVLTTHELEEAERLSDRLVILHGGSVAAAGAPAEVLGGAEEIRFEAVAGLELDGLSERLAALVVEDRPGHYRVGLPPEPATVAALTAWLAEFGIVLGELRGGRRRLEELFLDLVSSTDDREDPAPLSSRRRARRR